MGTSTPSRRLSDFAKARAGCRLVQTSGVLQPLSAAQAVPRRVRSSSSLVSRSDERGRVGDQFEPLVEMGNRLGQGHALQCQLARGLPQRNGGFGMARSSQVMRQYFRLGGHDVGEAGLKSRGRSCRVTLAPAF